jgi:hypothetical protein
MPQTKFTVREHRKADERAAAAAARLLTRTNPYPFDAAPSRTLPNRTHSLAPEYGLNFDFAEPGAGPSSDNAGYQVSDHGSEDPHESESDSDDPDWSFCQRQSLVASFGSTSSDDEGAASDAESDDSSHSDEAIEDISNDPTFATRASLFNADLEDDLDHGDSENDLPSAFYDHPAIRNAYIRVFVGCAFEHMTHSAARLMLDGTALGLESARRSTGMDIPGLDTFARTLATVEKRLGVSTHGFITYLFVCNVCWQVHRPEDLHTLPESGACTDDDCEGTLFTTKRMSDGKLKRTPTKIMPYVDPARAIAHRLARPGKYEQLQLWRGPGDAPGPTPPLNDHTGYDAFSDPDKPMKHISDGWAWRAISAGLTRRRTGDWKVEDVDVHELDQRFVSLPCGLVWQINIDWFVSSLLLVPHTLTN